MLTSGLQTVTVATEAARFPVERETCWTTNATMPAIAKA
jgi:hypothetical protein